MFSCYGRQIKFSLLVFDLVKEKILQVLYFRRQNFEICQWKYADGIVDPFTEQNNILMSLLMYYLDGVQKPPISLLRNTRNSKYNSSLIQIINLYLTTNNNFEYNITRQEGFVIITDCDEKYLLKGQSCAPQEHINKFKQQINYISFFTYVSTFNTYQQILRKYLMNNICPWNMIPHL